MAKKKKLIILASLIALLIVIIISADIMHARKNSSAASVSDRGKQAIPVQTAGVQTGDLSSVNTLTGTLTANLQTSLGAKVGGNVQSVSVDVGQTVHAGQVLAQLDPSDLQKQLAQVEAQLQVDEAQLQSSQHSSVNSAGQAKAAMDQARANYEQAQADYQRNETLYSGQAISKQQLEQSQLKMDTSKSQLDSAQNAYDLAQAGDSVNVSRSMLEKDQASAAITRQQLSELTITSPVDGIVATKNIEVGEQVSAQTTLFSIVQVDPVMVTVNVSDQLIASIKPGTTAQVAVSQVGKDPFQGSVVKVSPTLDQTSHAYPVQIQLANPDKLMLPGMTASVQFTGLNTQPGIIIPVQAVVQTTQGSEVFTVENNVAHMHIVQLGAVSSDKAVVLSGLNAGEQLVINGQSLLSDGARVNVVQDAGQAGVSGMINQIKQGAGQ